MKGRDLSEELVVNCFTEEDKRALEFTQGKITITLRDELDDRYGDLYCVHTPDKMKRETCRIINANRHLIEKIRNFEAWFLSKLSPEEMSLRTESSGGSSLYSTNQADARSKTHDVNISNQKALNASAGYARSLEGHPDTLKDDAENIVDKIAPVVSEFKAFNFKGEGMEVEGSRVVVADAPAVDNAIRYRSTAFARNREVMSNENSSLIESKNIVESNNFGSGASCNVNESISKTFNFVETLEKSYSLELKNLRDSFWVKFERLFTKYAIDCD